MRIRAGTSTMPDGVPMVALAYTADLVHALYPEYGKIAWEFAKRFSRDQKTGAISVQPICEVEPPLFDSCAEGGPQPRLADRPTPKPRTRNPARSRLSGGSRPRAQVPNAR